MSIIRNTRGDSLYPSIEVTAMSEDASFTVAESPRTLDVNAALGRNGQRGYIKVDGAGDLLVSISTNGTTFPANWTLKNGDSFDLTGLSVDSVRFTWSADTAYRCLVW